jgi:cytochrome P450
VSEPETVEGERSARPEANNRLYPADASAPQEHYRAWLEEGLVLVRPGLASAATREAVDAVLRHPEVFTSEFGLDLGNIRPLIPLSVDPPAHSRYRKFLDPLFTPRKMDRQEDDITERVNHFIDGFIDRGECDFSAEFAEVFPASVFLGLMGLPWEQLDTFIRFRDGILRPHVIDPDCLFDLERRRAVSRGIGLEVYEYFGAILEERSRRPGDDVLSRLAQAEVGGERLTREELLDICFLFLIAGLDTVSDSLTCFFAFLAKHPAHRRQIVEDPSIIPNAVEELLRWESPVAGVPRVATADCTVVGVRIPAGTGVNVSIGAANLDPALYADGFEIRFDRSANPHLAFGGGVHRCLGSHLARRELRVALREWHRRIPDYGLKPGHEPGYQGGLRHVDLVLSWPAA